MRLDRELPCRRLYPIRLADAPAFAREGNLAFPGAQMLDDTVGEDDVERFVRPGQAGSVASDKLLVGLQKVRFVGWQRFKIHNGRLGFHRCVLPQARQAADIEDVRLLPGSKQLEELPHSFPPEKGGDAGEDFKVSAQAAG